MLKVSPYHPLRGPSVINKAWDTVKDQVPVWEKESGDATAVLAALGMHYSAAKNYDDAQRVISRYIELSPDAWAYQTLAANFKAQGKIDRWQQTLEEFLNKVEDLGLDHAKVRVEIAEHYMATERMGQGQALCGSRRADVGRVGDGIAQPAARRARKIGRGRKAGTAAPPNVTPRVPGVSGICSASAPGRANSRPLVTSQTGT